MWGGNQGTEEQVSFNALHPETGRCPAHLAACLGEGWSAQLPLHLLQGPWYHQLLPGRRAHRPASTATLACFCAGHLWRD